MVGKGSVMGTICPKDHTSCPDDICRGRDLCLQTDTPLLERCPVCRGIGGGDDLDCICEPDLVDESGEFEEGW